MKQFTVNDGLNVQKENLAFWRGVLNKKAYNRLKTIVESKNENLKSGYDVCRGNDFLTIIYNM